MTQEQFNSLEVGDKVRIVSEKVGGHWNDKGEMDKWLGKVMTVRERNYNYALMKEDAGDRTPNNGWCWWSNMIAEKVNTQEIHITVDGDKTIAVLKENGKVVNRAEAKCNVGDTFDFETGAKLAFDRLFDNAETFAEKLKKELEGLKNIQIPSIKFSISAVKEVKREAKVDEYIKIINAENTFNSYKNGDVFKVKMAYKDGDVEVYKTHGSCTLIFQREYVVLEKYEPPKEREEKIKIGDRVEIINTGRTYTTYHQWFDKHAPKYAARYAYGSKVERGQRGKVVAIAKHEHCDKTLYAVDGGLFSAVYLVGEKGIKKV